MRALIGCLEVVAVIGVLAFLLTGCATRSGNDGFDWGAASTVVGRKLGH